MGDGSQKSGRGDSEVAEDGEEMVRIFDVR